MENKVKVGILSRISTSSQSNESGLEELRSICEKSDYEIVEEFHTTDISNIKKRRAFIERVFFKQGSKVA